MKKWIFASLGCLLGLACFLSGGAAAGGGKARRQAIADPPWLQEGLRRLCRKYDVPSLSAAVVVGDRVVAASAEGHRKAGHPARVTRDDRYFLMSVSKPMTSTLLGVLADAGKIRLDDTLGEAFPDLRRHMQPAYRKVNLLQLMSHTSGLRYTPSRDEDRRPFSDPKKAMANRMAYVRNALADPPEARPGTKTIYSGGHILAAAYAERVMGKPYEDLMEQFIFQPLGMSTSSHWTAATPPDRVDGPWAHDRLKDGKLQPLPPMTSRGHPRTSVAYVCCNMIDLSRWAATHLHGARGKKCILSPATFERLYTKMPPGQRTPCFHVATVDWAKGPVWWHDGCDGTWYIKVHIVPEENYATCVACNAGDDKAQEANHAAHLLMVKHVQEFKGKAEPRRKRR